MMVFVSCVCVIFLTEVQKGYFTHEIIGVPVKNAKGEVTHTVTEDEEYKKTNFEKIPSLKPTFTKTGTRV